MIKNEMTYLNERGQLSIPQAVQETLHWFSGMELTLTLEGNGLLIKPRKPQGKHRLEDLRGFLKHKGIPLSDEQINAPVDYQQTWNLSEGAK